MEAEATGFFAAATPLRDLGGGYPVGQGFEVSIL